MSRNGGLHQAIPFLKWAGGKQWLAPKLRALIKSDTGKYVEPFLGGGSVFFAARPNRALLSDSNRELIETFKAVQEDAEAVIWRLRTFSFTKKCYYRIRRSRPHTLVGKAARFIYLNRTCWNGLYRVNRRGHFNVPMGSFDCEPDYVVADRVSAAQRALRKARIICEDFEVVCGYAEPGDTVYLDPPYTVVHPNNGFLRYNERVFSWDDQVRLAKAAAQLKQKGCNVIVTNADHSSIIRLYAGFFITSVFRKSLVAGDSKSRRATTELLITSFPITSHAVPF